MSSSSSSSSTAPSSTSVTASSTQYNGQQQQHHQRTIATSSPCLVQACQSLRNHAPRTSNLAALAMHVTRMLREIIASRPVVSHHARGGGGIGTPQGVEHFSKRIALVGQAQAVAGTLNLFRILCHAVLVHASKMEDDDNGNSNNNKNNKHEYLVQCFTFTSRDPNSPQPVMDTSADLISALIQFLFVIHDDYGQNNNNDDHGHNTTSSTLSTIPELYDATVLALETLLVLFSPQLYQPMQSSMQRRELNTSNEVEMFFWDLFMRKAKQRNSSATQKSSSSSSWTPASLLSLWFTWQIERLPSPPKSIARHNAELARSVAHAKGERPGTDGMHENYQIVDAVSPHSDASTSSALNNSSDHNATSTTNTSSSLSIQHHRHRDSNSSKILYDATKGVLVFSSNIILLPFRLMTLAFALFGNKERGYDAIHKKHLQSSLQQSRTKDVLWLSESPLADLASCFLLLVANNNRAEDDENPFRAALAALSDNRWETNGSELPDLPDLENTAMATTSLGELLTEDAVPLMGNNVGDKKLVEARGNSLSINFEALFGAFGRVVHTELGAFLLYSLMQTSSSFADSIAVRSDLDTLVLPLLRTLYFACSVRHYTAQDFSAKRRPSIDSSASLATVSIRNCPFRSASQLYVIIILLLLFSQDPSFGPDAFRRVMIPSISFYKERNLKDISLGSVLVLSILRCLSFNLQRLGDPFLLSNCCAILMNLSPSITELYDYSAMRLASITFSSMKKYAMLRKENPQIDEEVDFTSPTAMYGEVSRTLLRVLKQCVSAKNVEGNLRLVYALVYHQSDFHKIVNAPGCPFAKQEYSRVQKAIQAAATIIEKADARTATKALKVLTEQVGKVRDATNDTRKKDSDDFTFTYEEEADPEIFFVPYLWEVVVCAVTASNIEWQKNDIQIFPLLDVDEVDLGQPTESQSLLPQQAFSQDVIDVV